MRHPTTLAFEMHALEDEETLVPSDPSPLRLPPMPRNWRRRRAPRRSQKLWGAGLGLFGLRRIPMVARVRERDLLWDALDEVRRDRVPRAFILQGAPGSGKSRLGEWLCERAHEVGIAHVMRAVHGPGGGPSDGLPGMLSTFLRTGGLSVGQIRQRVTSAMEAADQTVDPWEVHTLVGLLRPDDGAAFGSPAERHGVVRRFVEKQAARRPVVLFLDDVHWSLDTLEFAHSLLRSVTEAPVLVLLVARDDLLVQAPLERAVLDDVAKVAGTLKIPLLPLAEVDQRSLVEELLGLEGAVARLVEERSAGNPGFAVQLVGDWVQRGILLPGRRGFDLRDGAEVTLPDDLYTAWATRIEELLRGRPHDDRAALELAALLGQRVDRDEWRAACVARGLSPSADLVDTLLSLRLAVPDEAGAPGSWKFAHAMLRESLERSAEEHLRAPALHRACAAMVATSGHPSRERLARHLLGAGSLEPALDPLVDAIEARNRAGEFDRADGLLELWEFAVGQLGLPDGDPRWVRGLRAAVAVHRYKDRPEQLLRICRQLEDGVRRHGWPEDLLVYVRMQEGRLARMAGDFDRAVELFREGLELV
ncbi:MAG: AAA family ATPase, partial [Myxococcales bacterium]|nr:AAA family ATPase [Myxococcales bacterium]